KTEDVNAILQRLAALQQQSENGIPTQQLADALRELDDIKATLARSVPEEQFKAMQELFVRAEQRVSTMQQTVTEIFNNRYAGLVRQAEEIQSMKGAARLQAWEQFFEAEVRPFMREFNAFSEHAPDARRLLAEQVFGSPLNERQWQALQLAHAETDPMKKFRILAESIDNFDNLPKEQQLAAIQRIKRLMQTGLAGEAPAVADETARVGIRTLDLGAEYT